jgi:hypothetical protein
LQTAKKRFVEAKEILKCLLKIKADEKAALAKEAASELDKLSIFERQQRQRAAGVAYSGGGAGTTSATAADNSAANSAAEYNQGNPILLTGDLNSLSPSKAGSYHRERLAEAFASSQEVKMRRKFLDKHKRINYKVIGLFKKYGLQVGLEPGTNTRH